MLGIVLFIFVKDLVNMFVVKMGIKVILIEDICWGCCDIKIV